VSQANGRIIHGSLRPKDNDKGIARIGLHIYNDQLELELGLRMTY